MEGKVEEKTEPKEEMVLPAPQVVVKPTEAVAPAPIAKPVEAVVPAPIAKPIEAVAPPPLKQEEKIVLPAVMAEPKKEEEKPPEAPVLKPVPFNPHHPKAEAVKEEKATPKASLPLPERHPSHYDTLIRFAAVELEGIVKN